ncbi:TetR/AcrR family transcriptional regulator [Nocardia arthritidis]|uniref:TetR family transcriptional regulator n=1 Tax=Nocardia arthritidis TaxID=228602 RepID=A0A6G9YCR6_9NOCA|nr:TetR/AcrR family transcriptional regulator [Nocardia arthritidis]QIS10803.1 TetR family transcriptional regulator [Nocardia arthritidis]
MTEPATRRNRTYAPRMAPEQRRAQLLDAALRIIVEQGIHKVSMDAVARSAGVTRPVVYSQFTDTDDLLRSSLEREEQLARQQLSDIVPLRPTGDPAADVLRYLAGFLRAVTEAPDRWRAAFVLVDSATPYFRRRMEHWRRELVTALEDFVRAATTDLDVAMTARAIDALVWNAGRLTLAEPGEFPPARVIAYYTDLVRTHFDRR